MATAVRLIVGLGNPGAKYEATRHNAGFWFVDELARGHGGVFKVESKFHGQVAKIQLAGQDCWLLKPDTFMNRSGQSVRALASFYKIEPEAILVAHDELDMDPGVMRLKQDGGHGGHNGLRDIIAQLGSKQFIRLRMGIGHPGTARDVSDYVLSKPPQAERQAIEDGVWEVARVTDKIVAGELQMVMNSLHSKR